jgi:predicted Zn-dependent peptidase
MKTLLVLSAAALAAAPLHAAIDRSKKPEPAPAPAAAFPDYQEHTLSNGLKVFIIEDNRKPTLTLRLLIKSGSVFDGPKTGLTGFVASLLNRGTQKRTAAAFANETDFIGARLEAAAGPDAISVSTTGLTKYTEKLLDLMTDAVMNPVFKADEFTKQQRQTLSQLSAEKQESEALANKLSGKVLFGAHPYGAYRTRETVMAITPEDLGVFHKAHFLPNNASLAVVGDIKSATILPLIEKAFGSWQRGEVMKAEMPALPKSEGVNVHLVDRPGSVQSNIIVAQQGPPRSGPDLPELNVLNATLGGGFSGRLFQNLRERHGWTYGSSSFFDYRKHAGSFEATAETRNEVTAPAIGEILNEIRRIRQEPIPAPELELQRQYNVGNYLLSLENAGRTATRVQDIDLYGLPTDFYKTYAKRMDTVTAEQVQALANKYLNPDNVSVIVVGEAKDVKPNLEKIGKVFVYDTELKPVQ